MAVITISQLLQRYPLSFIAVDTTPSWKALSIAHHGWHKEVELKRLLNGHSNDGQKSTLSHSHGTQLVNSGSYC